MKPILFIDFDGTLCHNKFWRSLDAKNIEKIQNFLFSKKNTIIDDWMRGLYSAEEINQLVAKELKMPFKTIWKIFVEDCKNMKISKNTLNLIKKLRNIYTTILITDNMDCFSRFTVPAQKLDSFFDIIINSFENKKLKGDNDGEIFIKLANKKKVKIKNCILIDNSETACSLFSKLGGKSCLVTSKNPLGYWLNDLESKLAN